MAKKQRSRGRGEGSIQKRPNGQWRATISLGIGPDGKRRRKDIYGKTRQEVQKKLRLTCNENDEGRIVAPNKLTVAEYLKFWMQNICKGRDSTRLRYDADIRKHINPVIGRTRLQALSGIHIDSVISTARDNGLSARSQQHVFAVIRKTLNDARKRRLIGQNPCGESEIPQTKKHKHKIWTAAESQSFLKHVAEHRWFALFALAMFTGQRQGESLSLFWSDIDWSQNCIYVSRTLTDRGKKAVIGEDTKTESGDRKTLLPLYVMDALDKHRGRMMMDGHPTSGENLVFCTHNGTIISRQNLLAKTFKPLCRKAGVPVIKWHEMRHTTASLLLESGIPLTSVSELLGHANSVITSKLYAHATNEGMRRVAAATSSLFEPVNSNSDN